MKTLFRLFVPCFIALLICGCALTGSSTYYIDLPDAYHLKPTDPVLLSGKRVGSVQDIQFREDHVFVRVAVLDQYHLYSNTQILVKKESASDNQQSINIQYAATNSKALSPGDIIKGACLDSAQFNRPVNN